MDAILQKRRKLDEHVALTAMVDRSDIDKALPLADRGYESYNNLAHIQEKGWSFLIRIKDNTNGITSGLPLPCKDEYDIPFHLKLTRKQTNSVKELLKDKNHNMYNFCELITQSVVIHQGKRKHNYKVNFSDSAHICR